MVLGGTWSVVGGTGWYLVAMGCNGAVLVGTWCYWVSMERYWLEHGGTGSVRGGIGWYIVILGQYGAVLVGTW